MTAFNSEESEQTSELFEDNDTVLCYVTVIPQGEIFCETSDIKRFKLEFTGSELKGNSIQHASDKIVNNGLIDQDIFSKYWRVDTVWPVESSFLPRTARLPARVRQ